MVLIMMGCGMMGHKTMKHMFKRHHMKCLNNSEKMCIAGIISISFIRGIIVGMYLGRK